MGGTTFECSSDLDDVAEAYREAVDQALYDHGHSGYSGTIAEKSGYVVFELPAGKTPADLAKACVHYSGSLDPLATWLPPGLFDAYDDKWGPAVAVQYEGAWHFMGWASC